MTYTPFHALQASSGSDEDDDDDSDSDTDDIGNDNEQKAAHSKDHGVPPEHKGLAYDIACHRAKRAAYDKARRSTEAYKLQCKRKREQERAEEALNPDLARERKQRRDAQYQARKPAQAAKYQKNKERLAAKRSTPEMKAKKAAYDAARGKARRAAARRSSQESRANKESLAAIRSTPENRAKKAAHHQANVFVKKIK